MANRSKASLVAMALFLFAGASPCHATFLPGQDAEQQAAAAQRAAEEAARRRAEAAAAEEMKRNQQRAQEMMREFLTDSREIIAKANGQKEQQDAMLRRAEYERVILSFASFKTAYQQLAETISSPKLPKDHVKTIEKTTGALLDFVRRRIQLRGKLDAKEFKNYTAKELRWELLTTVERLSPQLEALLRVEQEDTVDVKMLMSLSNIEAQLLRLQWMTRNLK
jgi:hypothetical protein